MNETFSLLEEIRGDGRSPMESIKPAIAGACTYTTVLLNNTPISFGSGNIGRAAVNIVANRLLATGATPRYVSISAAVGRDTDSGLIEAVGRSIADAAVQAEMEIASCQASAGDEIPGGSGMILTATGVGELPPDMSLQRTCIRPGDVVILTGDAGTYGTAVAASKRNVMPVIEGADGNALIDGVHALLRVVPEVRDLIFPELSVKAALAELRGEFPGLEVDESAIAVNAAVKAACEIMDLNPLDMACAGSMLAIVRGDDAERALGALRRSAFCSAAAVVARIG